MSTADLHPLATGHIPSYVTQADGSDFLLTVMFIFTVVVIILIGVGYFTLHSIPEKLAHESNHPQFQLVGILALLALFTHNGLFWIAAILVAGFQFPDIGAPLRAIADAIRSLAPQPPADPDPVPSPEPVAQQEQ
ncbi:hypothetical protein [Ruegeria faecimaris]|uniref:Uncharacterized protein n=1 Tax=Ruegeria faecimaris TaxID=686389 RepID=A0A521EPG0_9RHOB|nr:hypothetical protein [Ruegeria faecimaris]SMO85010.1 hypothetical protein SAMN06265380_11231 [Ruegeria faecimaris]